MTHGLSNTRWRNPDDRFALILGIVAVIGLGVLPHLGRAVLGMMMEPALARGDSEMGAARAIAGAIGCVQIVLPMFFIMWASGRPWSYFGLAWLRVWIDVPLAFCYVVLSLLMYVVIAWSLWLAAWLVPGVSVLLQSGSAHNSETSVVVSTMGALPWWFLAVWMVLNGFSEELVTKAYLLPRIAELTGSKWVGIIASAAMFASYHIYQGPYATLVIFLEQAVLGWAYVKIRRIWPFAIGHAMYNLILSAIYGGM